MAALILTSPEPLSGKTTVAAGLARAIVRQGKSVAVSRLAGDDHAEADASFFTSLKDVSADAKTAAAAIVEAPSGEAGQALQGYPDAKAIVVANGSGSAGDLAEYCGSLGARCAGLIVNKAPVRRVDAVRADAEGQGLKVIAVLVEDRLLAAPVLRDVAAALSAQVEHLQNGGLRPLDRPVIATISADPGQGYFTHYEATAVIVRSDKPDLQLAALNAGAACLIVTGGLPILSYVLDRAQDDEIPLLRTALDTVSTVREIEGLFARLPFAGGEGKLDRISEMLAGVDVPALVD
ncbi:MAG TPA: DRTGG domain-containing protein [Dehalococcoidia bacterium]|jgi:BioD-like phosphotransacetylase family protein|nr:DRTGG domain-containing protein [Dehalococcoidia bacterium]